MARAIADEADAVTDCDVTRDALVFVLADVQDALDVLDGVEPMACICRSRSVDEACPVHGFSDAGL